MLLNPKESIWSRVYELLQDVDATPQDKNKGTNNKQNKPQIKVSDILIGQVVM